MFIARAFARENGIAQLYLLLLDAAHLQEIGSRIGARFVLSRGAPIRNQNHSLKHNKYKL